MEKNHSSCVNQALIGQDLLGDVDIAAFLSAGKGFKWIS